MQILLLTEELFTIESSNISQCMQNSEHALTVTMLANSFRCPLFMECVDEGLSEAQKRARTDRSAKFIEQMKKLEEMAKNPR